MSSAVFDLPNLLVMFVNIFAFVTLETLFFWFVASRAVEAVVEDKADLIVTLAKQNNLHKLALDMIVSDDKRNQKLAAEAKRIHVRREQKNIDLIEEYIIPVAGVVGTITLIISLFMLYKRHPLTIIDGVLLLLVFSGFTTEMYFYLTVSSQLIYLGDNQVIYALYRSFMDGLQQNSVWTILNGN